VRGALTVRAAPDVPARLVVTTARIGVAYAGADAARPWRFLLATSAAVSGPRPRRATPA
jgi:3-methyladenine DNA glycosylase Mpg